VSILRILALAAAALCLQAPAAAEVAVPPLQARVIDFTGTLSADQTAALERKLADFEQQKGSQIALLILPSTQPETIEQYGIRVGEAWKLGRKGVDDGAILIVAKDDHRLRIEVGYGLEGVLNDATCKRIIDEVITPYFRQGQFYQGLDAGLDGMLKAVSGEPLPAPKPAARHGQGRGLEGWWVLLIFAWIGASVLRGIFGRPLGAVLTAGVVGAIVWFLTGVLLLAVGLGLLAFLLALLGGLFGGWGGGGWGGGWGGWGGGLGGGGFSGGGGGFSGGGGGFGGGGASGSW
jgi:uncharacterized protein